MGWGDWSKGGKEKQAMRELPATPLHHPLLDYNATVTSDVPVLKIYNLAPDRRGVRIGSLNDVYRHHDAFSLPPETSLQMVPAPELQKPGSEKTLLRQFKKHALPQVVLPWVAEQCTPENFAHRATWQANESLLDHCSDGSAARRAAMASAIARQLQAALPSHAALLKSLPVPSEDTDIKTAKTFFETLARPDTFPTFEEKLKLHAVLRAQLTQPHDRDEYNAIVAKAPMLAAIGIGMKEGLARGIIPEASWAAPPGDFKVNEPALAAAAAQTLRELKNDLPAQVQKNLPHARNVVADLKQVLRTGNLDHPPLPKAQAEQLVNNALAIIPESSLAARLMKVGLSNPGLEIVAVAGTDTTAYWANFNKRNLATLRGTGVAGHSESHRDRVYTSMGGSPGYAADVLIEEILHNSFKQIYGDDKNQATYPPDIAKTRPSTAEMARENRKEQLLFRNIRKTLFLEAIRSDLNHLHGNMEMLRTDLRMPLESYNAEEVHAEAIVKIIALKADNQWTAAHARRYRYLDNYVEKVVAQDVADWEKSRAAATPFKLRDFETEAQAIRAEFPLITEKHPYPYAPPAEIKKIGGTDYFVLNGDHFATSQLIDPEKLLSMRLPLAPRVNASTPRPDSITLEQTPRGTIATIPVPLVASTSKRLHDHLKAVAELPIMAVNCSNDPVYFGPPPPMTKTWQELVEYSKKNRKYPEKGSDAERQPHLSFSDSITKTEPSLTTR